MDDDGDCDCSGDIYPKEIGFAVEIKEKRMMMLPCEFGQIRIKKILVDEFKLKADQHPKRSPTAVISVFLFLIFPVNP